MATYDSFIKNWSERINSVKSAGHDVTPLTPVIQRDYQTLQRGGEPLDHATANAIIGTVLNKPVLTKPQNPSHNPLDILGNTVKDVADMVTTLPQLPRAIYREGGLFKQLLEGKYTPPEGTPLNNPLQKLAATPGLRFIPGVTTLSNLTSPQGREQIVQHPLYTALDVAPLTGATAKLAAAGAESAGLVDRAAVVDKLAAQQVAKESGRAALLPESAKLTKTEAIYAAAAMGKPVGAVIAATPVKPLLDRVLNPATTWLETNTRLSRAHAVATRAAGKELAEFRAHWDPVFKSMTNDERVLLGKVMTNPELYPISQLRPEVAQMVSAARDLQRAWGQEAAGQGHLLNINVAGKDFYYSKSSPVAKALDDFITKQEQYTSKGPKLTQQISDLNDKMADVSLSPTKRIELMTKRNNLIRSQDSLKTSWLDSRSDFHQSIVDNAPAEYQPMIKAKVHQEAVDRIQGNLNTGVWNNDQFEAAKRKLDLGDYVEVFGRKDYDAMVKGIESGWADLMNAGYEPVFLHNAPTWRGPALTQGKVISTSEFKPGQFKDRRVIDMTPDYADVALGLTSGANEYITMRATDKFLTDHVIPLGLKLDEAERAVMPQIEKFAKDRNVSLAEAKDAVFSKHFVKVTDPEQFGFSSVRSHANMGGETLYFPKEAYNSAKNLMNPRELRGAFGKVLTKTNSLFKTSLFAMNPRHFADELFGNGLLLGMTSGRDILSPEVWRNAWQMAKSDSMPVNLSHGIDLVRSDELFNYAMGKSLGRIFNDTKLGSLQRATEFINKVQKSASYLAEQKGLLREGISPEVATDMAIAHANKALVDFDSMLPIERTIIRQIFPFYSWVRYVGQFLTRYPFDHPLRAAFISRVARQISDDEKTGLPKYFRQLFTLGHPDAQGNVRAIDARIINPLRDSYNIFSWAGFFSNLSPLLEIPLKAAGLDTLAATPELFPDMVYNPETGRLEAKRTTLASKGGVMDLLASVAPPTQTLEHFLTFTDRVRRLKATDPVAYRRQLFSALGVPFVPYQESIPRAQAREQSALSNAAKAAVATATRQGGSTRNLRRYAVVPWQGQVVSGEGLANLIDRLHSVSKTSGIPVRMLMDEVAKAMPNG